MSYSFFKRLHWLLLGWLTVSTAQATVYPLPPPDVDVIGQVKVTYANKDDSLIDIARRYGLGYEEIIHANPGVDRWAPGQGTLVVLPTRYILPNTPREGVVLNIAEMRLYYYPKAGADGQRVVHTYPVSIGRMDWKTPLGATKIIAKEVDPPWRPPASIKAEHAAQGDFLPDVVPGGPDNPMGRRSMRLGVPGYLIHSTNKPYGIGMRVTHGCVRMYPEDIEQMYEITPVGTTVRLVDQPVKVGHFNGELFVESHEPLEEENLSTKVTLEQAREAIIAKIGPDMPGVDQTALEVAVEQASGIPVAVSTAPTAPNSNQQQAAAYPPPGSRAPTYLPPRYNPYQRAPLSDDDTPYQPTSTAAPPAYRSPYYTSRPYQ